MQSSTDEMAFYEFLNLSTVRTYRYKEACDKGSVIPQEFQEYVGLLAQTLLQYDDNQ